MEFIYFYEKDGQAFSGQEKQISFNECLKLTGGNVGGITGGLLISGFKKRLHDGEVIKTETGGVIWAEEK